MESEKSVANCSHCLLVAYHEKVHVQCECYMILFSFQPTDPYQLLKTSLSCLPPSPTLNKIFLELASFQPLITLHYTTLTLHISTTVNLEWVSVIAEL